MFRSRRMSKVELVVPERDVVPVTEALAASRVFHIAASDHPCPEDPACQTNEWEAWAADYASLEQRIAGVMETLGVALGSPPAETPHLIAPEVAEMDVGHLEQEAQAPIQDLEEEQRRLAQLDRYVTQLEPLARLDVDLGALRSMRYTFVLLGTMPIANIDRLRSSLEHVPSVLVTIQRGEHLATVVLFGMQRDGDILGRAARSAYLNPLSPPETYRGTPRQALAGLESSIERTRQHIADYQSIIDRLRQTRITHLRHLIWRVRASRKLAETIAQYGRLRYTYLIAGWVPSAELPALEERIAQVSGRALVETEAARREDEKIPVVLDNPPAMQGFQSLVTTFGQPRYGELDPTPVMAVTFPLVFGMMIGDVGHGLVLVLIGLLLLSGLVRRLKGLAIAGPVLVACGTASTIVGVLYGSVFGFETLLDPLWRRPLENLADILVAAVVVGCVLLSVGMIYGILNAALARRWGRVLFGHTGVFALILYWCLIGLVSSLATSAVRINPVLLAVLAALSGAAAALAEPLTNLIEGHRPLFEDSPGASVMQAIFGLFEMVVSLMSNTLSYIRVGAFAVAHGALMMVVFIIAQVISPSRGMGYWIVAVLGNLFVVGFEAVIVGIQTLRLEYYEFFSKFFSGSGIQHRPLTLIAGERK
jgi:V/A-type H+-transporting ATPase subunit I